MKLLQDYTIKRLLAHHKRNISSIQLPKWFTIIHTFIIFNHLKIAFEKYSPNIQRWLIEAGKAFTFLSVTLQTDNDFWWISLKIFVYSADKMKYILKFLDFLAYESD